MAFLNDVTVLKCGTTFRLGRLLIPNMAVSELRRIGDWLFGCATAKELDDLDISGTCNAFKSKYANKRLNYNESHNSKLSKPQCSEPLIRALSGIELSHLLRRDHAEQAQGRHLDIAALPVRGVQ